MGSLWKEGDARGTWQKMGGRVLVWDEGATTMMPGGHLSYQRPPFHPCLCGQYWEELGRESQPQAWAW